MDTNVPATHVSNVVCQISGCFLALRKVANAVSVGSGNIVLSLKQS